MTKETNSFQAEVQELLNLMIHSLYSEREIFIRELISNASDAIDRLKFETLTNKELSGKVSHDFEIRLTPNAETKKLTISDNGIGMSKEEIIENIGKIAHSGTKKWLKHTKELSNNPELIGQFGVGFYSSFMVADKVTLHTQKAGDSNGTLWESDGVGGAYTIEEKPREEGCGTTITLQLKVFKDDEGNIDKSAQDFTDNFTLKGLVRKYSDFIAHPIKMTVEEEVEKDGKKTKEIKDETLNSQKALWERRPSEVKEKEYSDFYKHLTHAYNDPHKTIHFKAEGMIEFTALMYIPQEKPFNYDFQDYHFGLSLYVKRVFIMNDCEELLPRYLRFMRGMIDSSDLSLNVSREILQKDIQGIRIKKSITGKILNQLADELKKDRDQYLKFWECFGDTLKEGIGLDFSNRDKILDLFMYRSTTGDKFSTLAEYVDRMKDGQKGIYYITSENLENAIQSPYLEQLNKKGYEVLLLTSRIDEWVVGQNIIYSEKPFQSVMSEDLEVESEAEKKVSESKKKEASKRYNDLLEFMKENLKDDIKDVRISDRLTDSPVCLVSSSSDPTAQMEKMLKAMGQEVPKSKRILEINPDHPLFEKMAEMPKNLRGEWSSILYSQALLNEGSPIPNPQAYSKKIADLMVRASGNTNSN